MDIVAERITAEDIAWRAGQFASDLRELGFEVSRWDSHPTATGRAVQGFMASHRDGWRASFSLTGSGGGPFEGASVEMDQAVRDLALAWSGRASPDDVVVHVPTEAGMALLERMREGGR